MNARFYDIVGKWKEIFSPLINHYAFLRALRVYRKWNFVDDMDHNPLIFCNWNKEHPFDHTYMSKDELEILCRVNDGITPTDVWWYVAPHQCIELNGIVMATLCRLAFPDKQFYMTTVVTNNKSYHVVITDKKLTSGDALHLNTGTDEVILYDLYYPCMSYFGFCHNNRSEPLTDFTVLSSHEIAEAWGPTQYNYDCVLVSWSSLFIPPLDWVDVGNTK